MKLRCIFLVVFLYPPYTFGIELIEKVRLLESAGHYDLAEPLRFKFTQQNKSFSNAIEFIRTYPQSEYTDLVYEQAWDYANNSQNKAILTSFIKSLPNGGSSFSALSQLFSLYEKLDVVQGYTEFLNSFPNSPMAITAIDRIHFLAFEKAKMLNTEQAYDEYLKSFRNSKYFGAALERTVNLALNRHIGNTKNVVIVSHSRKESEARLIYNSLRKAEKRKETWLVDKYNRIINDEYFYDTKVLTELMDREELLTFRNKQIDSQIEMSNKIEELKEIYEVQSKIMTHHLDEINYGVGVVFDAIRQQKYDIEYAHSESSRLFQEAQRLAIYENEKNRECAELLAIEGKYTFGSGC